MRDAENSGGAGGKYTTYSFFEALETLKMAKSRPCGTRNLHFRNEVWALASRLFAKLVVFQFAIE